MESLEDSFMNIDKTFKEVHGNLTKCFMNDVLGGGHWFVQHIQASFVRQFGLIAIFR